jgi:hypothetical protein
MKILFIFSCFLTTLFFGCSKTSNQTPQNKFPLTGKWTLTETLADPGDGSGKWTAVSQQNYFYLHLNTDFTAETNYLIQFGGLEKYRIINDTTISLLFANGNAKTYDYRIDDTSLKITGGCYEACGSKFIRLSQ